MRRRLAVVAVILAAAGAVADPKPFGTTTTLQLPRGRTVQAAAFADVDGDGRDDVVVATAQRGKHAQRSLDVYLRRADGDAFGGSPDASLDVAENVVAFAVGDVHQDAGSEVVAFTASGAFAWRLKGPEDAKLVRLATASFLWQLADPREIFHWDAGLRDVDGDGLDDLVLPEPDGWRIALQRRPNGGPAAFPVVSAAHVPEDARGGGEPIGARKLDVKAKRRQVRVSITIGDDEADSSADLLSVTESAPAPQFADFDGDGRDDLLALTGPELLVWRQAPDGTFRDAPDARFESPVPVDGERRLDVSYGALVGDIDGEHRADCVFFAGDKRSDDVRTQVLVYIQGKNKAPDPASPLFGAKGLPTQFLRIAGFAGSPRLTDVDGDGRDDLFFGSVRLDGAFDAVRAAGRGTLDAELYVYRNRGAGFSEKPDLVIPVPVKAEGLRNARRELLARFFGDITGDGVSDLLLHDDPERLRVLAVRRTREGLELVEKPVWEMSVAESAKVVVREGGRGRAPELLVLEGEQVLHVRWP